MSMHLFLRPTVSLTVKEDLRCYPLFYDDNIISPGTDMALAL